MIDLAHWKKDLDVLRTDEHVYLIFKCPTSGLRLTCQQARDLAATLVEFAKDTYPPRSAA